VETAAVLGGRSAAIPDSALVAAARRDRTRERLREETDRTYLAASLSETDSMLRRWPDARINRPLRVAIIRQNVDGFREDFVSNVNWAIGRWNGVIPVLLETGADSANADIVVTWTVRMDSNRTGRTDLTWDRRGNIRQALIVLATHTPEGQLLDARRMSALALHEVGHAIGLGHSTLKQDALYPVTLAQELSERDIRTARLLYDLPAGSIR
jgi:predicted Zn-dependent protease